MRVLVCGGREFDDWNLLNITLHETMGIYRGSPPESHVVISGDSVGADWLARSWAKSTGRRYEGFPANWKKYGKAAGPIRNQQMLDEGKPDLVVAFSGGVGTADMVKRAKNFGVDVVEIT